MRSAVGKAYGGEVWGNRHMLQGSSASGPHRTYSVPPATRRDNMCEMFPAKEACVRYSVAMGF